MANYRYRQIAAEMRSNIDNNIWAPSSRIPTEEQLQKMYNCSRQTIRHALSLLTKENRIYAVQGSGSYVKPPVHTPSKRIAVITTYISEYIFPSIMRAIESTMEDHGYTVLIKTTRNSVSVEREKLMDLAKKNVDGIIVEGTKTTLPNPNVSFYESLAKNGIPIVFFNSYYEHMSCENICHVTVDDYGGGKTAVDTLVAMGHTKIGGIFKGDDMQGVQRYAGYIEACSTHGILPEDRWILWYTTESRKTFLNDLSLETKAAMKECTALVVYNDMAAEILLEYLKECFPSVTAVFTFDNKIRLGPVEGITILSLDHPKGKLGEKAAEKLLSMMEGHTEESLIMEWDTRSLTIEKKENEYAGRIEERSMQSQP